MRQGRPFHVVILVSIVLTSDRAAITALIEDDGCGFDPEPALTGSSAAVTAFDDVVRAAQLAVADATGISASLTVPTRCVDRAGWSRETLDGLEPVLVALANAFGSNEGAAQHPAQPAPDALFAMVMQSLVPLLLGGWAGSMIGLLSHHALGQYDLPIPRPSGDELLVTSLDLTVDAL
jgi:hypothetical protein